MAQDSKEPDICVVGGGAGGLAVAAAAAAMGVPVVLIEKGRVGGQSLISAVQSKALLAAAKHAAAVRSGAQYGVRNVRSGVDFVAVMAHVRDAVRAAAPQISSERFVGLGVRIIAGTAQFKDANTIEVGDATIKARRFVLATGSLPIIPAIPGLAEVPYLTPHTMGDLADYPRHLIVIGAGGIGLELAQTFRRLGSEVTVLEANTPLKGQDPECAAVVLDALEREGIKLRTGVRITQVRRLLARIQIVIAKSESNGSSGDETIEGTHLLVAAGRRPNIEELDLEAGGIRHDARGIVVDKYLRTSNKKVFAIGDVIGGPKFAHVASHHAGLVVRNALSRYKLAFDRRALPRVISTDPELAQIGLLEDEARKSAGAIRILRWPYMENDRAITADATNGHIKVITDRRGSILGVTIVGAGAAENIAAWSLAVGRKLKIDALAGLIVPYPTYGELGKRAAATYFMRGLTSSRVRRIIGWLRRPGGNG
jgi:pyruvate/2-oxoglutarate dehydrogenase complex dihydrolipoamide dehydrogenase (E3) component